MKVQNLSSKTTTNIASVRKTISRLSPLALAFVPGKPFHVGRTTKHTRDGAERERDLIAELNATARGVDSEISDFASLSDFCALRALGILDLNANSWVSKSAAPLFGAPIDPASYCDRVMQSTQQGSKVLALYDNPGLDYQARYWKHLKNGSADDCMYDDCVEHKSAKQSDSASTGCSTQ